MRDDQNLLIQSTYTRGPDPLSLRMAGDTAEQAEKEEAVFTSGAIIGSESFVSKIVQTEEEAFPTGHKTHHSSDRWRGSPVGSVDIPVDFGIGGVVLKTLRNLKILR